MKMTKLQKLLSNAGRYIKAALNSALVAALLSAHPVLADSVGQVQTTKYFAPETVALILQRVQDVANGVPGATLGFKTGDTISYIIQFTPVSNGGTIGAGGYITDYIPAGTQVTNAQFVQPDGAGGFYQVTPPAPAQMDDGTGNIGGGYTSNWTTDAYTIATCTQAGLTLATCNGNLAQLYADTGIFYSTDPRTAVFTDPGTDGRAQQWSAPTGNGYNACPTRGMNQLVPIMGGTVTTCAAGGVSTHNYWDAAMTSAYGTTSGSITTLAGLPRTSGNPQVATARNGAGVPPFNSGSPVAGPDTGYQLDYTGNVGPWHRIAYPGSMVGSNAFVAANVGLSIAGNPATTTYPNDTVLATPTGAGASFPLATNTTAVRWAAGRLVVGSQSFVKISLLLTAAPPSAGLVNNSEVFGGDESPEAGGGDRDSAWVYHVPSVASNVSTLYVLKSIVCVYNSSGTCVANSGADLTTTGTPITVGPKVRYQIVYINTNNGTLHNVTICDQLPNMTPQGQAQIAFATGVTQISNIPNIGMPTSPAAAACNFAAGGTTFSYPTIPVLAGGGSGIIQFDVQYPVLTNATVISNQAKAVSNEIPAGVTSYVPSNIMTSLSPALRINKTVSASTPNKGDTVSYTITVDNTGGSTANLTTLVDNLPGFATGTLADQAPSRVNYVATSSITVNGTAVSGVAILDTLPAAPATTNSETVTWTFPSGTTIPAGGQLVVTFTATIGNSTAANLMVYGTAYSNTATINCPNCTTTAVPVTSASITPTAPNLYLTKTIDCVFSAGVCTAGSYVVGDSIPTNAELRYKIVYSNPALSAQTITLTDTVPASTTSAGNLYVASGPDIRPSSPVLSVNPAAAGAARGVDAALTALAGSSVVIFATVSLPANSSGTLYMDVQTNVASAATATNLASIQSTQRAAAGGAAVTSSVSAIAASLAITKVASSGTVAPGGTVNYTITVINTTGANITLTSVVDTLPLPTAGTIQCGTSAATCLTATTTTLNGTVLSGANLPTPTWAAAGGGVGQKSTWTFAAGAKTLNAGATLTLVFTATYSTAVPRGNNYYNNATLNYTGGAATTGPVAPVNVPYNTLSISKAVVTPASASITPNSAITYAITVTNTGSTPAAVTSVVDTLPSSPTGTIAYTSTSSVLVNGVAQTAVTSPTLPVGAQYQSPAPAAAVAGTRQVVTWPFPAAGTTIINPGSTMVITFVVQYGTVTTGVIYTNDVQANYTGGLSSNVSGIGLAPVNVPLLSTIIKTVDCIYIAGVCTPGSYVDGTPIPVNAMLGYKIVYGNLSSAAATGVTITDILPTQTGSNSISNLIINGTPTTAPGSAGGGATVTLLSGSSLPAYNPPSSTGTITFAVQTTATVGAGVTNTAKMTTTQDPLGVTSSITEAATGAILSVSKAVTTSTPSTVAQGGTASYTITVTNSGAASGTLTTLVDTLPGVVNAAGATWRFNYATTGTMTLNGSTVTPAYTLATTIPPAPGTANNEIDTWTFTGGLVIPAGQTFTLTFTALVGSAIPNTTPGVTYYNNITANYTGGAYTNSVAVGQAPVYVPFNTLTMTKTIDSVWSGSAWVAYTAGSPVPPNAKLRYLLSYSNLLPSSQATVTVNDTLPASTTAAGNLYVGSGPDVRPSTPVLSVNSAAAGGVRGADVPLTLIGGGTAVKMTSVTFPALSSGTLYIDVQTNAAANTSISNCASISTTTTATCATAGVVSSTASVNVLNVASLGISKTTSTPTVVAGINTATYTISITNTGSAATSSLKVYDFLPYSGTSANSTKQLTYITNSSTYGNSGGAAALPAPTITTSTPPTVAPYASNLNQQQVSWDFGNYSLAVGGTVTITFNATVGANIAPAAYTNSAREEYTSSGISLNANLDNAAAIVVAGPPSLTMLKTVNIYWDPINLLVNPKFIPGAQSLYTLIATNSGTGPVDNNALIITDPVPANTALYVNNIGGTPAGPVAFANGATASGLSLVAANISYSSTGIAGPWTYVPVPGADGCDPAITHLKINPQGKFAGSPIAPSPSFQLTFRVCVK